MEEKHMGMLDDVKVLDFCTNAAGPVASAEMADYGAQVIKIEIGRAHV